MQTDTAIANLLETARASVCCTSRRPIDVAPVFDVTDKYRQLAKRVEAMTAAKCEEEAHE